MTPEARLRELLAAAGVDPAAPAADDVQRTWDVWRQFAAEPAEDVEDAVLAQYGTYGGAFELDLTRQLTTDDGEMTQLHCTFRFEPTAELEALGEDELWSFDYALDDFFTHALDLPGFRHVREREIAPLALDIGLDEV